MSHQPFYSHSSDMTLVSISDIFYPPSRSPIFGWQSILEIQGRKRGDALIYNQVDMIRHWSCWHYWNVVLISYGKVWTRVLTWRMALQKLLDQDIHCPPYLSRTQIQRWRSEPDSSSHLIQDCNWWSQKGAHPSTSFWPQTGGQVSPMLYLCLHLVCPPRSFGYGFTEALKLLLFILAVFSQPMPEFSFPGYIRFPWFIPWQNGQSF